MTNQLQNNQQHHQQQRLTADYRIPTIEKYAYCLCLHVKPTTIFIAVFRLIRALLFASILLNSEFSYNEQFNDFSGSDPASFDRNKSTAIAVNILTRMIMASVSAVGIYAVISGRAALLMPLYAILLVDFFITLPAFYHRDLDPSLADSLADFRNYPNGNNQYTRYSLMLFSTITMIVKIYFLCVIWKCYRYLRLIELVSPLRLSEIYPHIHVNSSVSQCPIVRVLGDSGDISSGHSLAPPPYESIASNMKPPNYEEAMKSSSNMTLAGAANPSLSQQQTVVFTTPASTTISTATTTIATTAIEPQQHQNNITNNNDSSSATTIPFQGSDNGLEVGSTHATPTQNSQAGESGRVEQ